MHHILIFAQVFKFDLITTQKYAFYEFTYKKSIILKYLLQILFFLYSCFKMLISISFILPKQTIYIPF